MRNAPGQFAASNITTSTTTTLKTGQGVLRALAVGNGGTAWTATIYDNTAASGTKIGTFTLATGQSLPLDVGFTIGLTVVTAGTAGDLTVVYA